MRKVQKRMCLELENGGELDWYDRRPSRDVGFFFALNVSPYYCSFLYAVTDSEYVCGIDTHPDLMRDLRRQKVGSLIY